MYKLDGNEEFMHKNFSNAIYFFTEGINVSCKDEEVKAKIYNNRAAANFHLGEDICIFLSFNKLQAYFKLNLINTEYLERKSINRSIIFLITYLIYFLFICIISLTGNYNESLSDAKVAISLQPRYIKAIVRGTFSWKESLSY